MTTLITGAAGYVGRHLTDIWPERLGALVLLDRFNFETTTKIGHTKLVSNLTSVDEIVLIIKKYQIKSVIHLAADKSISASLADPNRVFSNNISTTNNLLESFRLAEVKNFVFASSAAVYKMRNDFRPTLEEDVVGPLNAYGESKLICERLMKANQSFFSMSILRFFNLIGSSSTVLMDRSGENAVPIMLRALKENKEFKIYGSDHSTDDGFAVRDFVDVRDAAAAIVAALEYTIAREAGSFEIFNVCSGKEISLNSVVTLINEFSSVPLKIGLYPKRIGELSYSLGNYQKLSKATTWKPCIEFKQSLKDDFENFFDIHGTGYSLT
jgi:UDP-glucose 4-epimerase